MAEQARLALAHGVPQAVVQRNGDMIRLAPGAPTKIDEVRVGRLVLDGIPYYVQQASNCGIGFCIVGFLIGLCAVRTSA